MILHLRRSKIEAQIVPMDSFEVEAVYIMQKEIASLEAGSF